MSSPTEIPKPSPESLAETIKQKDTDVLNVSTAFQSMRKTLEVRKGFVWKVRMNLPSYDYGWLHIRAMRYPEYLELTTSEIWKTVTKALTIDKRDLTKEENLEYFKLKNHILGNCIGDVDAQEHFTHIGEEALNNAEDTIFTNWCFDKLMQVTGLDEATVEAKQGFFRNA